MSVSLKNCDMSRNFVFVSYSDKDKDTVYPLVQKLQEEGCNIWIDSELQYKAGYDWQEVALRDAIANSNCKAVLFMVSRHSLASVPVYAELMWSQNSPVCKRGYAYEGVDIIPVVVENEWISSSTTMHDWVRFVLKENQEPIPLSQYDNMKIGCISKDRYEDKLTRLTKKGEVADVIYYDVLGGNKVDNKIFAYVNNIDSILKSMPQGVIYAPSATVKTSPVQKQPEPIKSEVAAEKIKKKSFSVTGDITYTLYGKEYTDNQSDMMLRVFEETLKRHSEVIPAIIDMQGMNCLSRIDYTQKANRTDDMPSYFRVCRYFMFRTGSVCVGTAYGVADKCKKIALLFDICGESHDVFNSEQVTLPEAKSIKTR